MLTPRIVIALAVSAAALGCASPPRVQQTSGPTAELNDRLQADDDESNPRVFAVTAINGVDIPNALNRSTRVGWGHGQGMLPYMLARYVEARPTTYRVRGAYLSRAPIEALVRQAKGKDQAVEGELTFSPKDGGIYRLNGTLSPRGSSIWIENFETGEVVSKKVISAE